jgi:hypothetical protein
MGVLDDILGGESKAEKSLRKISTAGFMDPTVQGFLPPSLQHGPGGVPVGGFGKFGQMRPGATAFSPQNFLGTGNILESGIQGIGDLIRNPGALNPQVAEALNSLLAMESQNIAQNFRGIGQQQAGALARGNVPVSIRGALESALSVAQERAQRGARQGALGRSEELRRQDLQQTYAILDAILQFTSAGKGQAVSGLRQFPAYRVRLN